MKNNNTAARIAAGIAAIVAATAAIDATATADDDAAARRYYDATATAARIAADISADARAVINYNAAGFPVSFDDAAAVGFAYIADAVYISAMRAHNCADTVAADNDGDINTARASVIAETVEKLRGLNIANAAAVGITAARFFDDAPGGIAAHNTGKYRNITDDADAVEMMTITADATIYDGETVTAADAAAVGA